MSRFPRPGPCAACLLILGLSACPAAGKTADPPPGPHQLALELHRDTPTHPSLLHGVPGRDVSVRATAPRPCATIFGYLPYWSDDSYLRYDLLTHLACFAVEVNADGTLGNDHDWPWTATINDAHQNGAKVILVATLFDADAISTLITTPENRQRFFENIRDKMLEGNADGLNVDFESGTGWQSHINGFMTDLTAYLHARIPGCEVTFAGPAVNWSDRWDLAGLADACDGIFIMGYQFNGSWSATTGPNAPLIASGGGISITDTVVNQYADVRATQPEKLILGVPYYGLHWTCQSQEPRSPVVAWEDSPRFFDAQPQSQTYGLQWEAASQTPWYRWHDGTDWHQVWFDNADSLALKYELAMEHGLQGVGMWALGYDDGRNELWNLLEDTFTGCHTDTDGDGVADDLDRCPDTPPDQSVDGSGCPMEPDDTTPGDPETDDEDSDGLPDTADLCPDTPDGETPDADGCAASQRDADADGVMDNVDLCPDTPPGQPVNTNGCTRVTDDADLDGVRNDEDLCPGTPEGLPVDGEGCARWQRDHDGDGVSDDEDQCADTPVNVPVDAGGCGRGQFPDEEPAAAAPLARSSGRRGGTCGIGVLPAFALALLGLGWPRAHRAHGT